jgi:branched-chain amino acid transport system permease protein
VSLLIVGLLLVFFVIIAPNGLIGLWQQYFGRRRAEAAEGVEVRKPAVKTS